MVYDFISHLIKKHLYVVHSEKFESISENRTLERIVAKHPLLRPQLIVVNDQLHGFKKISNTVKSLEEFPIFIDLEYRKDEDGHIMIESIDMMAETRVKPNDGNTDLSYLAQLHQDTVLVEKISQLNQTEDRLIIISKLNEVIFDSVLEEELCGELTNDAEVFHSIEAMFTSFIQFLKLMDGVLIKGKRVNRMDQMFKLPNA
jgi:hypothetical protein